MRIHRLTLFLLITPFVFVVTKPSFSQRSRSIQRTDHPIQVAPLAQQAGERTRPSFHQPALPEQVLLRSSEQQTAYPKSLQSAALFPEIARQFAGNSYNDVFPTDNTIAISDEGWVVSVVNSTVSYYFEDGSIALNAEEMGTFFDYLGLSGPFYNPKVIYDPLADHFIFAVLHGDTPENSSLIISFSLGQDPAEGWWSYNFEDVADDDLTYMQDLEIGLSAEDLYVTGNLYPTFGNSFRSVVLQIDKDLGYVGENLGYNYWEDLLNEDEEAVGSLLPVSHGLDAGYGPGIYLIGADPKGGDAIQLFEIDNDSDNEPLLSGLFIEMDAYSLGEHGAQMGSSKQMDVGDCRMQSAYIIDDVIHYTHHDRLSDGSNAIRYGQLDMTAETITYLQLGIEDQTLAYPALLPFSDGSDNAENILIAFSHTAANSYPSFYVLSLDGDLTPSEPVLIKAGTSPITTSAGTLVPWGHYTGISRKHNEDRPSLWAFGNYGSNNAYAHWIAEVVPTGSGLNLPCELAEELFCGSRVLGTTGGNPQLLPDCPDPAVNAAGSWYRIVGHGGNISLSACSDSTNFDTRILVFEGGCAALFCTEVIASSGCTQQSGSPVDITFYANDGDEYFIFVSSQSNTTGNFGLSVSCEAEEGTCNGGALRTECNGTLTDGSGINAYSNDLSCSWTISPFLPASVTLSFSAFETEEDFDYVRIYDGTSTSDSLLGSFSGSNIPEEVTAYSGSLYLLFETDGSATSAGWNASYSCTEQQLPVVDFLADSLSGTAPFTVDFTNLTNNPSASYLWDFGDGNMATARDPTHTYELPGTYTVQLKASNLAGADSLIKVDYITVVPKIVRPAAAFTPSTVCGQAPLTVDFQDLSANEPTAWYWDFGNAQSSTEQQTSVTYTEAGIYTVELVASNSAGSDTLRQVALITVIDAVEVNTEPDSTVCFGEMINLQATGAETFHWTGPGLSNAIGQEVTVSSPTLGTFSYSVVGTTNGCSSAPTTFSLSFASIPVVNLSTSTTISCVGTPVKLIASGADTYQWEGVGIDQATGSQVIANPVLAGSYSYQVIGTANGCPAPPQTLSVLFNSTPRLSVSPSAAQLCEGDSLQISVTGAETYFWQGPDFSSSDDSITVSPALGSSQYEVSGTVNGCQSAPELIEVLVNAHPTITVSGNEAPFCLGDTVYLEASGAAGYQWQGQNLLVDIGSLMLALPADTGSFSYNVIGSSEGCNSPELEVAVEVINNPLSVSIVQSNCPGPDLTYSATLINGGTTNSISWFVNDSLLASGPSFTFVGSSNGDEVYCIVEPIDASLCTQPAIAVSNTITVDCIPLSTQSPASWGTIRLVPNPNDGAFRLSIWGQEARRLQIQVFNTLGQQLYQQPVSLIAGEQQFAFDLDHIPAGVYWLVASTGFEQQNIRFIKK